MNVMLQISWLLVLFRKIASSPLLNTLKFLLVIFNLLNGLLCANNVPLDEQFVYLIDIVRDLVLIQCIPFYPIFLNILKIHLYFFVDFLNLRILLLPCFCYEFNKNFKSYSFYKKRLRFFLLSIILAFWFIFIQILFFHL